MNRLVFEIYLGEVIHIVIKLRLDEIMSNHRIEHLSLYLHSVIHQHFVIVLDVLSHFQDFRILVERFEDVYEF